MKTTSRTIFGLALTLAIIPLSGYAQTSHSISFDDSATGLRHGSKFNGSEYSSLGPGVTFNVDSNGDHDQLIIFDTNKSGTADPDLESPFAGGNLKGHSKLGNALIIAENILDRDRNGLVDSPDDEGRGGTIGVVFGNSLVQSVGFSLYDTPETPSAKVSIVFKDARGKSVTWAPSDLIANGSNVKFANHYGNHFSDISAEGIGLSNIQSIDFNIESGAIDNLTFQTIPEPSSAALIGLSACGFLLRRRRA
ncbi:MAG: PEP-CTERM sorting domain-containing protein [Akkermansiaceae bacterium]